MATRLLVLLLCAVWTSANPVFLDPELDDLWDTFKTRHNKVYQEGHEKMRRFIWEDNVRFIRRHNLEADMGKHTFHVGMNEYGDWTDEEYAGMLTSTAARNDTSGASEIFMSPANVDIPDEIDWVNKGYVTPVKNQAACGSCWAFSATGSLEGQHFRKTGHLVSLSEQNLVDCSTEEGNHGCHGGFADRAFLYIKRNGGIDTESSYPYRAKDGECHFKSSDVGATCRGYVDIPRGNEELLRRAVATVGPISVGMDASRSSFRFYRSGVYMDERCSSTRLDHGVLAVGYGEEGGMPYWHIKNSWGTSWGYDGYFRMARNHDNMCGVATTASFPLV